MVERESGECGMSAARDADIAMRIGLGYPTVETVSRAVAAEHQCEELLAILQDLIAELRRSAKGYLSPRAYAITVEQQREMADAAEARLREVSGE